MSDDVKHYPHITFDSWVGLGHDPKGCKGVHRITSDNVRSDKHPLAIRCGRCQLVGARGKRHYSGLVLTDTSVRVGEIEHTCPLPHKVYLAIIEEEPHTYDPLPVEVPDILPAELSRELEPA